MDLKSRAMLVLKFTFTLALVYFCLAFLIPKWQSLQLTVRLRTLPAGWLAAAGAVLFLHYLYLFALWRLLLRYLGSSASVRPLFRAYVLSLLPKYIPGKIVAHGVKARLALEAGVGGPMVTASLVWEVILVLGSASLIGIVGLLHPAAAPLRDAARWLILVFALGTAAFVTIGSTRLLGTRWKEWVGVPQLARRPLVLAMLFVLYAATWITFGLSHWFLANAILPTPLALLYPLTVALAVSWGLGFLSVIAPAGLGIREGVLYFFVLGWMSEGQALLFVTLSRVLSFGMELALTALWGAIVLSGRLRSRATVASDP